MIVFDASSIVGAALTLDGVPEKALLHALQTDILALSAAVDQEIAEVISRPKFAAAVSHERRERILYLLRGQAVWFTPHQSIRDCRDEKDNKYLELALTADAETIVSSDRDLTVLNPWRNISILRPAEYLSRKN